MGQHPKARRQHLAFADLTQASAANLGSAILGGIIFNAANILLGVVVIFSVGILLSDIVFNTFLMKRLFAGTPVSYSQYFKGGVKNHTTGILGGAIWCLGMSFSIIASGKAAPAISYGLGQGATIIAACWGIFIWKEFRGAPKGTGTILAGMLLFYLIGLSLLVGAGA